MRKVILSLVLVAVMALAMGLSAPAVVAEGGKEPPGTSGGTFVVTNGIYTLSVEDNPLSSGVGTYTISTGVTHPNPNQDIFYDGAMQMPWSTYLTVRVYDTATEYVSTNAAPLPSAGYTVVALDTCSPLVTAIDTSVTTAWTTPENLGIEQLTAIHGTTLSDSMIEVTTTVTNQDSIPQSVGIRYEWDIMIDGNDGSWFAERIPDGPWLDTEAEWVLPAFERYETTDNPGAPLFSIFGTVTGPAVLSPTSPDLLQFANWREIYARAFDYTLVGHTIGDDDSAVGYYWGNNDANKITLVPGESVSVTTYLFAVPPVNTPPSTAPVVITDQSSATPTISWTYFDVEGDPQAQHEVEVWTGAGGTGTPMWDPPIGAGAATSVVYAGDPLISGQTYYARVRANDGTDWGDWSEAAWTFTPVPPVPGMTGWGIMAAAITLVVLTPLALRRRRLAGTGR